MLITISGLYGSGGHELGYALGEALGYSVYGRELISESVKDSGLDMHGTTHEFYDEDGEKFGENDMGSYAKALLALEMDVLPIGIAHEHGRVESKHSGLLSSFMDTLPIAYRETIKGVTKKEEIDKLVASQSRVVNDAADKGSAIFLGRCASFILGERRDMLRIFTCASLESCRARITEKYGFTSADRADDLIKMTNRRRALYYETFTDQKWDDVENYDYCINTDCLGFDKTLELLKTLIELKEK